jgi:hypothetical protein
MQNLLMLRSFLSKLFGIKKNKKSKNRNPLKIKSMKNMQKLLMLVSRVSKYF